MLHTHIKCVYINVCVCVAASRAKLTMINTMSKIRGQEKGPGYPQAETVLAEAMQRFGRELGEESSFGKMFMQIFKIFYELLFCMLFVKTLTVSFPHLRFGSVRCW